MAELKYPDDLRYAKSDEWVRVSGDIATLGISDYAQDALNDIVYVDLPEVGETFKAGEAFGTIESVKAASDLYTPLAGEVVEVNAKLEEEPELINTDPYGAGWLLKLKVTDTSALSALMDAAAYRDYNANRDH